MLITMWYSLYDMSGSCLLMNRTLYMLSTMWYSLYDMSGSCLLEKQKSLYAQHHVVLTLLYVRFLSVREAELPIYAQHYVVFTLRYVC
jgi:hypothetical protein